MSDTRQQRIEVLKTAARRKSEEKTRSADAAIARLIKRGEPVTFQAVQREAGVSHAFLSKNTRLRARIEHQRRQHRPAPDPISLDDATDNNIVAALTAEIATLKARHRVPRSPHSARHSNKLTVKTSNCVDSCSADPDQLTQNQTQTTSRCSM